MLTFVSYHSFRGSAGQRYKNYRYEHHNDVLHCPVAGGFIAHCIGTKSHKWAYKIEYKTYQQLHMRKNEKVETQFIIPLSIGLFIHQT